MRYLVNSIGHVQLDVTDMAAAVRDATEILGLHVTRTEARQTWLSSNGRKVELVLRSAEANAARCVGFEAVSPEAVQEVSRRVPQEGCRLLSKKATLDCCAAGVVFATPHGHVFEVHTPIPDQIYGRRHFAPGVGASRIDHVNITSPDPAETQRQLEAIIGLKLSEKMVDDSLIWRPLRPQRRTSIPLAWCVSCTVSQRAETPTPCHESSRMRCPSVSARRWWWKRDQAQAATSRRES
jgi:catechol 2,3-dioxygenase